jgi:peptidoglycan/LPS O-acetylase OafA/YrhL
MQALGSFAVPIFLFISGSFVAYAAKGDPPKLTLKFLRSSLIHILSPYILWSAIFYFILYINRGIMFSVFEYGKYLIVGYPFHFIPLLAFFYLISPILIPVGKRMPWILIMGFLVYQIFLINFKYSGTLGLNFPNWTKYLVIPILGNTLADWGVCFPLGIVFSLNSQNYKPWLSKLKWLFGGLTIVMFSVALVDAQNIITAPLARFIGPIVFLFAIPVIKRNSIPAVRQFEEVGKRSYGIYLTHLIILDSLFLIISKLVPKLFQISGLLTPFMLFLGITIPIFVMTKLSKSVFRKYYRYIFG